MLKTYLINTFKILVAGLLIGWLLRSGKLDFKLISQLQDHLFEVAAAVVLSILNLFFISFRWKGILKARCTAFLPITGILRVNWIGQFFSSVLPGSVSGDLVKILYIQKYDQSLTKKFVFASILIDRVMGLSGLILLVGLSSLFFQGHILENAPAMKPLLETNYILAGLVIVGMSIFLFAHDPIRKILLKLQGLFLPNVWEKIIGLFDDLTSIKPQMVRAILISVVVQFTSVVVFWSLIYPFVGEHMDFVQALAFIPLGLMTLALPVAPSGLGVGHAIFQKLFEYSGIDNGASLFNLYFVVTLCVNVLGVIPYLLSKGSESARKK
jgi:glycosyltransferase 2 family protein